MNTQRLFLIAYFLPPLEPPDESEEPSDGVEVFEPPDGVDVLPGLGTEPPAVGVNPPGIDVNPPDGNELVGNEGFGRVGNPPDGMDNPPDGNPLDVVEMPPGVVVSPDVVMDFGGSGCAGRSGSTEAGTEMAAFGPIAGDTPEEAGCPDVLACAGTYVLALGAGRAVGAGAATGTLTPPDELAAGEDAVDGAAAAGTPAATETPGTPGATAAGTEFTDLPTGAGALGAPLTPCCGTVTAPVTTAGLRVRGGDDGQTTNSPSVRPRTPTLSATGIMLRECRTRAPKPPEGASGTTATNGVEAHVS